MGIKLLYITNGITGSGGLERVLSVKASMLAEEYGYEIHILSLNEAGKEAFFPYSERIVRHSIATGGNPICYFCQYRKGLIQKVNEVHPDVISVCDDGLKGFFVPQILGKKIPIIYERHASVLLNESSFQHQIMKLLAPVFNKFIVLTKGNLKEWPEENAEVIPNPLSFYPEHSAKLFSKKVIAVGSHSHNKGYDLLLNIWQKIESAFPDWTLEIYGKYNDEIYQNLATKLNLKNVSFYMPVSGIEDRYLDSSVFVLPSRSEGFGMVIIEAMSCGLPVVSFDCPHGPADIITDGKDGFLIPNGNTEMFAEKLKMLLRDKDMRRKFGMASRTTAQRYFADKVVKQWDELFQSVVKNDSPR